MLGGETLLWHVQHPVFIFLALHSCLNLLGTYAAKKADAQTTACPDTDPRTQCSFYLFSNVQSDAKEAADSNGCHQFVTVLLSTTRAITCKHLIRQHQPAGAPQVD